MMPRKISALAGGVQVMALAAGLDGGGDGLVGGAAGGDDGHVRIQGRISATMAGVSAAAETLKMLTPASTRAAKSVSGRTTVEIRGISTVRATVRRWSREVGWLATTPMAPCISAKNRHMGHAVALGQAAAHAHEYRHVGSGQQRLGDHRLGREGIDGDDGVGVGIFDDGQVRGKDQGLDPLAEDHDA